MNKLISFVAFAALFLISFAGLALADSNLDVSMSSSSLSGQHNSAVSGSFTLSNLNASSGMNNIACTATLPSGWSLASCSVPASLIASQNSSVPFTVNIPQYTLPGTYSGTLNVSGNVTSGSGIAASDTQTFTVTVATSGSYTISWSNFPTQLYQGQSQTATFTITNTGNVALTTNATMDLSALNLTSVNQDFGSVASGNSVSGTVALSTSSSTFVGDYTLTLNVNGAGATSVSTNSVKTLSVLYPYCDNVVNPTSSPIRIDEVLDKDDIEDEDYKPLDTIKLEVKIDNLDDDDKQTAVVEAVLVFEDGEVSDTDVKEKIKIDKDKTEKVKLNLTIPSDAEEGTYFIYIKVYNDDDDDNCEQEVLKINVEKSSREVVPVDVEFSDSIVCDSTFTFSGDVVNLGRSDEEKVLLSLRAFGQTYEDTFDDLDEGDSSSFNFDIAVPKNTTGSNKLVMTLHYDYDEDDEKYDDRETFTFTVNAACSAPVEKKVEFKPETSTVIAGTESTVRVLLRNPSSESRTYELSATADWGTIVSVSPPSLVLAPNTEQYVSVKVTPNQDASAGTYVMVFKAAYGGTTESVSVPVNLQKASEPSGALSQLGFKLKNQFSTNPVWLTLDAVLVLAILAVLYLLFVGKKSA